MSEADFGEDLKSKEQLLIDLVVPLLDDLESTLDRFPHHPTWPDEGQELLTAYLDVLLEHRDLVIWIDGDMAVLGHPTLGARLTDTNRRIREAIRGGNRSPGGTFRDRGCSRGFVAAVTRPDRRRRRSRKGSDARRSHGRRRHGPGVVDDNDGRATRSVA